MGKRSLGTEYHESDGACEGVRCFSGRTSEGNTEELKGYWARGERNIKTKLRRTGTCLALRFTGVCTIIGIRKKR